MGAGQRLVHTPCERWTGGETESAEAGREDAGAARQGLGNTERLLGWNPQAWMTLSPGSGNLSRAPAPLAFPERAERRAQARLPPSAAPGARTPELPRERPRDGNPGLRCRPPEPEGRRRGPSRDKPPGPRGRARGGEKPLPFHFLPGGGGNEVSGLRWGCGAPWRPRSGSRPPVRTSARACGRGLGPRVGTAPLAGSTSPGWERPPPPHPDSVCSDLLRF